MHKKVTVTLTLGFIMGLGLVSCATSESRAPASDNSPRYSANGDRREEKIECNVGEQRNEDGDCERPHNFDRPFRRGGR